MFALHQITSCSTESPTSAAKGSADGSAAATRVEGQAAAASRSVAPPLSTAVVIGVAGAVSAVGFAGR